MAEKICFIIMGFGEKTDFSTGNIFDLDKTYKYIVQPAVVQAGYRCVRANEIHQGGHVDRNIHSLLVQADLVIADISSNNPDVIYELGVRNAFRPFFTIVIKEKGIGKMPFDLDQTRMFTYTPIGENLEDHQLRRSVNGLTGLINKITNSPFSEPMSGEFMNSEYPSLSAEEMQVLLRNLTDRENYILSVTDKAKEYMSESAFDHAYKYWEKAAHTIPREIYFIQQLALSKYKSKKPSLSVGLKEALVIIEELHPTADPETLGITGAIYKKMYLKHGNVAYLNKAIEYYGKGFKTSHAYYNGENYALCLEMKAALETEEHEKKSYLHEANQTREKIIELLEEVLNLDDFDHRTDRKWMFATLAHCYFLKKDDTAVYFEKKFFQSAVKWEKQTYQFNKEESLRLCRI